MKLYEKKACSFGKNYKPHIKYQGESVNQLDNTILPQSRTKSNIFEEIKNRIDIINAVEHYGAEIGRTGFGLCPFHTENTPSFKAYPDTDSFYCFGCGASGNGAVGFVMRLFGLNAIDAARRLNTDFRLNLMLNRVPAARTERERTETSRYKHYVEAFKAWEIQTFRALSRRYWELREGTERPANVIRRLPERDLQEHISNLAEIKHLEWLIDTMIENTHDFEKQAEFYKAFGEAVERL